LVGVSPENLPPAATRLRRLLHFGQTLQSHALHFFHLASPDLLFGFESDVALRNIVAVLDAYPEIALHGVKIRKYGQEIIQAITGKRVHGSAVVPGGMNAALSTQQQETLLRNFGEIDRWCEEALALIIRLHQAALPYHDEFATIPTHYLSLSGETGALELYHGGLRVKNRDGTLRHDHYDYHHYGQLIHEEVKSWSYMKFPYLAELGSEEGWYRVGPLARVNNCDQITTPRAEKARREFISANGGGVVHATLGYHWARMIESLHCAESIRQLLQDPQLSTGDLEVRGERQQRGIGVIEAPRGTLFHHYEIDEQDLVTKANLIVSTTSNNQAMNESIRQVANRYLRGRELTDPLLNQIEVAIRAYDPCLSCATHALGKMPLQIELQSIEGRVIDRISRNSLGGIER
ncbi:MAG: Ni/Fe hydrogenase subunit alpha, partial [Gammaproteobacteria bacterium]|nr:Ni/Fe hydrogenase subunit alpha [Gammaproteobacteria bacterium]